MKRLTDLPLGKTATIKAFEKNDFAIELMEMGCIPGELIRIDQIAPLGDPISVYVAGYYLSLRLKEANSIIIEELI